MIKVALYAQGPTSSYVDYDDVHVIMVY